MILWLDALIVLLLNIPFGYWRANTDKFSRQWILAIHLAVPLVIAVRYISGLGWAWYTFPVLIAAFFSGQYFGSAIRKSMLASGQPGLTSCLVMDLYRNLF